MRGALFLMILGVSGLYAADSQVAYRGYGGRMEGSPYQDRAYYHERPYTNVEHYQRPVYQAPRYVQYPYYNVDNNYVVPAADAESYNDITNPEPGDSSNSTNFQNSNFDNQVWDLNN